METLTRTPQAHILELLNDLPPESLTVVEQFVEFVYERSKHGRLIVASTEPERHPPYLYPSIGVPAKSLDAWRDLVPEGYAGDALADTEALYDNV